MSSLSLLLSRIRILQISCSLQKVEFHVAIYNFEMSDVVMESGCPPPLMAASLGLASSTVASLGGMSIAGEQLKNPCGCNPQQTGHHHQWKT